MVVPFSCSRKVDQERLKFGMSSLKVPVGEDLLLFVFVFDASGSNLIGKAATQQDQE